LTKKGRSRRRKKPKTKLAVFWGITFLVIGAFSGAWWLWSCLYNVSPQFNFILIKKNEHPLKLLTGELLRLHPKDKVRILKVSTNICFNHGVRLVSSGVDVNALLYEEKSFSTLLPSREVFDHYQFRVDIKRFNLDMGHVDIVVEPFLDDWLDKAQRIIDPKKRVAILERAMKLVPDNEEIKYRLIEEYKSLKRWQEAALMLEKMDEARRDEKILYDLLEVYESMSKKDEIVSVLRRLVMYDQRDVNLRYRLASLLEESDQLNEAILEYESILKLVKKEEQLPIYKTLGYLYTKTNQINKAIASYLRAVELDKKDANLYYNLSSLYEKVGKKNKADFYLGKAVSLKSGDIESQLVLAERLIKKGKRKEAEKHLKIVLKKKPNSTRALILMIDIAEKTGDKKKLKEIYRRMLSLDPKNETIIYNLGVLEYETGHFTKSESYLKKFVSLHPRDVDAHSFLFDIYRKQKKDDLAFKEAEILAILRPKEISYYHFMVEYLYSRGDFKRMIPIMRKALKSYPTNLDFREYLILAYLKTGKEELAVKEMDQVLKIKPNDTTVLLQLAKLHEKQGRDKEALKTYGKILDISPGHSEAEKAYLRLRFKVLGR
jgi:tetratricopeptide (TPR) repeat protein